MWRDAAGGSAHYSAHLHAFHLESSLLDAHLSTRCTLYLSLFHFPISFSVRPLCVLLFHIVAGQRPSCGLVALRFCHGFELMKGVLTHTLSLNLILILFT